MDRLLHIPSEHSRLAGFASPFGSEPATSNHAPPPHTHTLHSLRWVFLHKRKFLFRVIAATIMYLLLAELSWRGLPSRLVATRSSGCSDEGHRHLLFPPPLSRVRRRDVDSAPTVRCAGRRVRWCHPRPRRHQACWVSDLGHRGSFGSRCVSAAWCMHVLLPLCKGCTLVWCSTANSIPEVPLTRYPPSCLPIYTRTCLCRTVRRQGLQRSRDYWRTSC